MEEVLSRGVNAVGRGADAEVGEGREEEEGAGGRVERNAEMREGEEMVVGRGMSMLLGVRRCSMSLIISLADFPSVDDCRVIGQQKQGCV